MDKAATKAMSCVGAEGRALLLQLAHHTIATGARTGRMQGANLAALPADALQTRGVFVSVYVDNELRGCTGELVPQRSLAEGVAYHAFSAAFRDSRFPEIREEELDRVRVEISVLSPLSTIEFANEAELLRNLRPAVDGLLIECNGHSATFLPQVWKSLPEPGEFLAHLKRKAGLPAFEPCPGLCAQRYTVEVF